MIETTISVSLSLNLFHSIWNAILLVFIILTGDGRRVCVWEESVSMDSTYIFLLWWHLFHRPGSQCGIVPTTNYMFRDGVGTHYEPPLDQSFIYYFIIPMLQNPGYQCQLRPEYPRAIEMSGYCYFSVCGYLNKWL